MKVWMGIYRIDVKNIGMSITKILKHKK